MLLLRRRRWLMLQRDRLLWICPLRLGGERCGFRHSCIMHCLKRRWCCNLAVCNVHCRNYSSGGRGSFLYWQGGLD